ncbi:MAG: TrmH family RNA methyltransferase [Waddliaceae bacterium]
MNKEYPILTSLQNPRIKQVIRLRDRKERDRSGLFIIEGYRELLRALDGKRKVKTLFTCPELFLGTNEQTLIDRIEKTGAQVLACTKAVFHKLSYRDRPDGLVAVAPQQNLNLEDITLSRKQPPLLVVAEAIEKPGNLGTILRSSDAVGVDALIVCDRCTDIHNPNVVRASVGTLFTVPVIEAKGKETLKWLKDHRISILAATPQAEQEYTEVDMTQPLSIAVGTEQLGLSDLWMERADIQVRIPMFGVADSLNVATATTLLLYEAVRQRGK